MPDLWPAGEERVHGAADLATGGPRRTILLVDDEAPLRRALARVLRDAGYAVIQASSVAEALQAIESPVLDAIVTDVSMPGDSGLALCAAARERGIDAPVLLMTGVPTIDSAVEAVERGALRYLRKPVGIDELVGAVREAVRAHDAAIARRKGAVLLADAEKVRTEERELAARFERAIASMALAFQPIVQPKTRALLGFEALLRCGEPSLASPGNLLSAAEHLGRLEVLGRAIRRSVAAVAGGAPAPLMFVNLHPRDLLDEDLYSPSSALASLAGRVVLEITERTSLEDLDGLEARIARLKALGYRIAVDDLGAGYSGLTSILRLRPDVVKLDMALVRHVDSDPAKMRLVKAMVSTLDDLGAITVGEGVETPDERDALADAGCQCMQGYLFARPGPPFPSASWT